MHKGSRAVAGERQYNIPATKVEGEDIKEAAKSVQSLIKDCALMKQSHRPPCDLENLATICGQEENSNDDVANGSFAEYLRYAVAHWELEEQQSLGPVRVEKARDIFRGALMEPFDPAH